MGLKGRDILINSQYYFFLKWQYLNTYKHKTKCKLLMLKAHLQL